MIAVHQGEGDGRTPMSPTRRWLTAPSPRSEYEHPPNFIVAFPKAGMILGVLMMFMCICSFCWHASLTKVGSRIDIGAMYLVVAYLLALVVMRAGHYRDLIQCGSILLGRRQPRYLEEPLLTIGGIRDGGLRSHWMVTSLAGLLVGAILFTMKVGSLHRFLFFAQKEILGLFITVSVCGVFWFPCPRSRALKRSWAFFGLGLVALLIGFIARLGDQKRGWLCKPKNYHGHAWWHVFASISILFFYLYFRSETLELLPVRNPRFASDDAFNDDTANDGPEKAQELEVFRPAEPDTPL